MYICIYLCIKSTDACAHMYMYVCMCVYIYDFSRNDNVTRRWRPGYDLLQVGSLLRSRLIARCALICFIMAQSSCLYKSQTPAQKFEEFLGRLSYGLGLGARHGL